MEGGQEANNQAEAAADPKAETQIRRGRGLAVVASKATERGRRNVAGLSHFQGRRSAQEWVALYRHVLNLEL